MLAFIEICADGESPCGHISHSSFRNGAILDGLNQQFAPKPVSTGHAHVQSRESVINTTVLGTPVRDNKSLTTLAVSKRNTGFEEYLKAELALQQAIQRLAVAAAGGVVDAVVRTHDV